MTRHNDTFTGHPIIDALAEAYSAPQPLGMGPLHPEPVADVLMCIDCDVSPADPDCDRCAPCMDAHTERAAQRELERFYGSASPVTDRERAESYYGVSGLFRWRP